MDSVGVVVLDVFAEKALKVLLIQNDHVVEKLPASAADPSFRNPVLPGASKGRPPRLDSNMLDRVVCQKSAEPNHAQLQLLGRAPDLRFRPISSRFGGLDSGR